MPADPRAGKPGAARATGARHPASTDGKHAPDASPRKRGAGLVRPGFAASARCSPGISPTVEEVGAAVCVYLGDTLAVDLWGGIADARTGRPWQRDTPCLAFSCTKALTATCALHLWERGGYEMDVPVTAWWPEFGQAGKDKVTPAHLLSHQAGLPAFDETVSVADTADPRCSRPGSPRRRRYGSRVPRTDTTLSRSGGWPER